MTADLKTLFDRQASVLEARLRRYARELIIDVSHQVRGQLPNRNLAPLDFNFASLFENQLSLANGGTGADLSGTGPGVAFQATPGAVFTVGDLPFAFLDFTAAGSFAGALLIYDGAGGATFDALDLSNDDSTIGILKPGKGGTGVNNGTRNLTIATNGGTIAFSASGKTLTISETLALTGTSSGFTLTVPATGTAALIGLAQTFSANQTIAADLIFSGNGRRITGVFDSATATNRPSFQSSTTNGTTVVQALPNGTATTSGFAAYNGSDPDNASRIVLTCTSTAANFNASFSGTGSAIPLKILISAAEAASFNTDQSVSFTKWLELVEITAPSAPAANGVRIYAVDNGAGKTRLMALFSSGAAQQIAIQP